MKKIPLTKGQFALVDDSDFDWLNQYKWYAIKTRNGFKAARLKTVLMHRVILGLRDPKILGEHRDGNGLNNQRSNLRTATKRQNEQGFITLRAGKTSRFRGVYFHKHTNKWMARIQSGPEQSCYLGIFSDEVSAALAYDQASRKYFGEFACPNFP